MVCKMLIGISYTVESVENQLFMAVLCKMYEMCVITKYRLFDKNSHAPFRDWEQCRAAVTLYKDRRALCG